MNYSLEKISTVGACDVLLAAAQKQKQNLERTRRNMEQSIASFQERLNKISAAQVTVQVLLQSFTTAYALLPEGKDKANLNVSIKRLELRKALLDKRSLVCNAYTLLKKQLAYNLLHTQVSAMDRYIAAVHDRRMDLDLGLPGLGIVRMGADFDSRFPGIIPVNPSAQHRETSSHLPGLHNPEKPFQPSRLMYCSHRQRHPAVREASNVYNMGRFNVYRLADQQHPLRHASESVFEKTTLHTKHAGDFSPRNPSKKLHGPVSSPFADHPIIIEPQHLKVLPKNRLTEVPKIFS